MTAPSPQREELVGKLEELVASMRAGNPAMHEVEITQAEVDQLNLELRANPGGIGGALFLHPPRWARTAMDMLMALSLTETGQVFAEQPEEVREEQLLFFWNNGFEEIAQIWNRDFIYGHHVRLPGYFMNPISFMTFRDWMETWPFTRDTGTIH